MASATPPTIPPESDILVASAGPITTLTLNRPDALNAITPAMLVALDDALAAIQADASQRVVVVTDRRARDRVGL